MLTTLKTAYRIATNLGQIRTIVTAALTSIVKTVNILEFILKQTTDTKLGKVVDQYLPPVISILGKVKELILKYGPLIGLEVLEVQSASKVSIEELEELNKQLNELLK